MAPINMIYRIQIKLLIDPKHRLYVKQEARLTLSAFQPEPIDSDRELGLDLQGLGFICRVFAFQCTRRIFCVAEL